MKIAYSGPIGLCLVLFAGLANAQVVNGGFENFDATAANGSGGGYWTYNAGNTGINGWTVGDVSVDIVDTTYPVFDGNSALDIVGTPGPGSVSQTLTGLADGDYVLTFYAYAHPDNALSATLGGTTVNFSNMATSWTQYQVVSTIAGGTANLSLEANFGDNGNLFIDDVSVTPVPEPCSMVMLGLAAAGLLRRKLVLR